jgi:hypothetical protein
MEKQSSPLHIYMNVARANSEIQCNSDFLQLLRNEACFNIVVFGSYLKPGDNSFLNFFIDVGLMNSKIWAKFHTGTIPGF